MTWRGRSRGIRLGRVAEWEAPLRGRGGGGGGGGTTGGMVAYCGRTTRLGAE